MGAPTYAVEGIIYDATVEDAVAECRPHTAVDACVCIRTWWCLLWPLLLHLEAMVLLCVHPYKMLLLRSTGTMLLWTIAPAFIDDVACVTPAVVSYSNGVAVGTSIYDAPVRHINL